ncbi:MAG: hypothetical protein R2838_17050 [Caldilineaceae bacterium]
MTEAITQTGVISHVLQSGDEFTAATLSDDHGDADRERGRQRLRPDRRAAAAP